MEKINLCELFPYDELSTIEKEKLLEINLLTKTRVDENKSDVREHYGIEQSFLIYNIAKKYKSKSMVEIGTGRGTASYSVSLLSDVNRVDTFDIVEHTKKTRTAVKFKSYYGSNKDIYNMIPYKEKEKINFKHIYELDDNYLKENESKFDLGFIDGNHSNYKVIRNDFENCLKLVKKGGVIIFDDYGNFPVVTNVVNDVMKEYKLFKYKMVPFRGHYFMKEKMEKESGELICFLMDKNI